MAFDDRIGALVGRWEDLRSRGEESTLEELCRDCPELVDEVRRAIDRRSEVSTAFGRLAPPPEGIDDPEVLGCLGPAQGPDEIGRLGPYRVVGLLGAGGMGAVFRAVDPQLGREVALKTLKPTLASNALARKRFLREARAAAAIEHDHVVAIYQVGEDRGVPYLAMPLLKGRGLEDRLREAGRLPAPEVLRIGREVADGLAAAHGRGLVHRDIKPGNIWLEGERGRVKVLDFGLASIADEADDRLTRPGEVMGTPAYMAPEQAGGESTDFRCDLFSLGAVLYRMGTGRTPFTGKSISSVLAAVLRDDPEPPRRINADLPPALAGLILRLLAKDPADRPPSAAAVAEALGAIERDLSTVISPAAHPAGPEPEPEPEAGPDPEPEPARRGRMPVRGLPIAAVALVLLAGLAFGPQVLRVATDRGQLVIETTDPDVQVTVKQDGRLVTILDTRTGRHVDLKSGAYEVELSEGKPGLKLSADRFTLRRGDKEIVKVTLEPPAVSGPEANATTPAAGGPRPPSGGPEAEVEVEGGPRGFRPLFNGHDLTGWAAEGSDPAAWTVEDGAIVGRGQGPRRINYLLTDRAYADFVLRLEFALDHGSGGGLCIRARPGEDLPHPRGPSRLGHPVFVLTDFPGPAETGTHHWLRAGNFSGSDMKPDHSAELEPAGSWNTMRIAVRGQSMVAFVNGKPVLNIDTEPGALLPDGSIPALDRSKGRIGLQSQIGMVRFRNISVRELPPEPAAGRGRGN